MGFERSDVRNPYPICYPGVNSRTFVCLKLVRKHFDIKFWFRLAYDTPRLYNPKTIFFCSPIIAF